ncbi:MAG: hypothetical protein O2960_08495, partial [Verrucomicrobia bacterium]|nr:hypothetical protein [Verrucomicrobiota bacterium]
QHVSGARNIFRVLRAGTARGPTNVLISRRCTRREQLRSNGIDLGFSFDESGRQTRTGENIMCGIVGYIGRKQAAPIIVEGLRRLVLRQTG